MHNSLKRLVISCFIAVFLLNTTILPMTGTAAQQVEAATKKTKKVTKGTVSSSILNIRNKKSTSAKRLVLLHKGDKVTLLSTGTKWVKISYKGIIGYTQGRYISTGSYSTASDSETSSSKGQDVVNYAVKFVGNPYVWGGTSLTHGADCSGFVMSVYRHFGKSLPHSSYSLRSVGTRVSSLSKAKPGDLICYSGHVAIYMGNNRIVHASNKKDGIKISNNASYRKIVAIRRIFK